MRTSDKYGNAPDAETIIRVVDKVQDLLITKNASYGASATNPVRVFSKAGTEEQILVRIDDKLSRIARAHENALGEDTVLDLVGYLVLLLVARENQKSAAIEAAENPSDEYPFDRAPSLSGWSDYSKA